MNRLNYNYYYFAFDVLRQSNYKMFKNERVELKGGKKQGVFPSGVIKLNLC